MFSTEKVYMCVVSAEHKKDWRVLCSDCPPSVPIPVPCPAASSPMDEVLASLKRGSFHLRKAELRVLRPDPGADDGDNILAQIRKGVKLRKVQQQELRRSLSDQPADSLTRSIHEALRRIKEASPESEDEEDALPCADWES